MEVVKYTATGHNWWCGLAKTFPVYFNTPSPRKNELSGTDIDLHGICLLSVDIKPYKSCHRFKLCYRVLYLAMFMWKKSKIVSKIKVIKLFKHSPLNAIIPALYRFFITQSTAIKKSTGENMQPCLTPVITWNFSVTPLQCNTLLVIPSYIFM